MNKIITTAFFVYSIGVGTLVIGQTDAGAPAAEPSESQAAAVTTDVPLEHQNQNISNADHLFVVINFAANSSTLSNKQKQILKNSMDTARTDGIQLDRVIVAAWSDSALPLSADVKLPDAAIKLADERARNIETVLKEFGAPRVDTHSMAEHANWFERLFSTNEAQIKDSIPSRGSYETESSTLTEPLVSNGGPQKALVLIIREKEMLSH